MSDDSAGWLERATARCEAATPGPWRLGDKDGVGRYIANEAEGYIGEVEWERVDDGTADFIAHARTDLPRALGVIQQIRDLVNADGDGYQVGGFYSAGSLAAEIRGLIEGADEEADA